MVRARLTLVLLLGLAAPAWAGRTWELPQPVTDPLPEYANAAVGPDGTTIAAWTVDDGSPGGYSVYAREGAAPPVRLGATGSEHVEVGAGPGGRGEVLWAASTLTGLQTQAAFAAPDGTFSAPATVGAGAPLSLATDAGGDAAVLMQDVKVVDATNFTTHTSTAFAGAGGPFGTAVDLPDTLAGAFSLSPAGETLIGMGLNRQNGPTAGLAFYSRTRDGAVTGPTQLTSDGRDTALAGDASGRVLAVWTLPDRTAYFTAVRAADGTWAPTVAHALPAQLDAFGLGMSDAGDAVLAWRDVTDTPGAFASPLAGPLRVATGSLGADRTFGDPVKVADAGGTVPYVRTAPDGTTVIAYADPSVKGDRVVRRDGTGAFASPQTAACDTGVSLRGIPGVTAAGDTALLVGGDLVHDHASDPSGKLSCPRPVVTPPPVVTPTPVVPGVSGVSYSADPVMAGQPVTITAAATGDVGAYRFVFVPGGTQATGATPSVRHVFPRPGLAHWALTTQQAGADVTNRYAVDVFARATLKVRRTGPAAVRIRANAFTAADRQLVTVTVRGRGKRLARAVVRLGARPSKVTVRLSRAGRHVVAAHRRTPVRVALVQDGRRLRTVRAVIRRG